MRKLCVKQLKVKGGGVGGCERNLIMKSSHLALYIRIACGFHHNWLILQSANNKRSLLSEVFVISGKIKVEVIVISLGLRLG